MSARRHILQRIARGAGPSEPHLRPVHVKPAIAGDLAALFCSKLEQAFATWEVVHEWAALPGRVVAYRQSFDFVGVVAIAPVLSALDWPQQLSPTFGTTDGNAVLAVSQASLGVAETGSLKTISGPDTSARLNFLPDHQIVVLSRTHIVGHLEDAWLRLEQMPRVVNLVTGPSRTADIEQTMQLGAHGPRRLHVLLLDSEFNAP